MVNQVYRYETRDGKIFDTEGEAIDHENALPDAALRVELAELADEHTEKYEGVDMDGFTNALLERYNVEKKPVLPTGELRTR